MLLKYMSRYHQLFRRMTFVHLYSVAKAHWPKLLLAVMRLNARGAGDVILQTTIAGTMAQTASPNSWQMLHTL